MEIEYTDSNSNSKMESEVSNINNIIETNKENEIIVKKSVKYDHTKKMEIKKKIEKIKKKEYLIDIFKIITLDTKDYSENNNGVFIFFHDLSDETYEKVDNYVNNIYRMHKTNTLVDTENPIFNSELSESMNDFHDKTNDKNLSNKEKIILRRKKYEEYLTHNQN
jgi:hypothetical protein